VGAQFNKEIESCMTKEKNIFAHLFCFADYLEKE